jgi:poly(glycerol-phosphate) alpha-glucosyltransferase
LIVYSINKAIGRASSGVEYAQSYRNQVLSKLDVTQKYIYTDFIEKNLIPYAKSLKFEKEKIIWIYSFLANRYNHECSFSPEAFESQMEGFKKEEQKDGEELVVIYTKGALKYKLRKTEDGFISHIDMQVNGKIYKRMYYTNSLSHESYYQDGKLSHRIFYDNEGEIAYTQYYDNNKITVTVFKEKILFGKSEFLNELFTKLEIKKEDFLIIDRSLDNAASVLRNNNGAKTALVIHAEHYHSKKTFDDYILWNNYYEYSFVNHKYIDYFITATQKQAEIFTKQMTDSFGDAFKSKVVTIPVGAAEDFPEVQTTIANKFKLITASRLADEKHVDDVVKAVIKAKEELPELSLDIYGEGKHRTTLASLIKVNNASDYIQLKGHQDLTKVYPQYGVYVSASLSEGFGLSLLEALSNGLVFVGYDVDYGNTEFMLEGENAKKIPFEKDAVQEDVLKNAILSLYGKKSEEVQGKSFDIAKGMDTSFEHSKNYTTEVIKKLWAQLLDLPIGGYQR